MLAAARCQIAQSEDQMPLDPFATAMDIAGIDLPTGFDIASIASSDHQSFLKLDIDSPFRNCAVADMHVMEGDLEKAEALYKKAISLLPEYGAAHFGLGYLLRRSRRHSEAAIHLRLALICPLVFWGGSFWAEHILPGSFRNDWARKSLLWVKGIKEPHESLKDDPFLERIHELKLETGVVECADMDILSELVVEYTSRGQHLDALMIWMNRADRAAMETTSFRKRYNITPSSYAETLSRLLRNASCDRRAELLADMLNKLANPNALHL